MSACGWNSARLRRGVCLSGYRIKYYFYTNVTSPGLSHGKRDALVGMSCKRKIWGNNQSEFNVLSIKINALKTVVPGHLRKSLGGTVEEWVSEQVQLHTDLEVPPSLGKLELKRTRVT